MGTIPDDWSALDVLKELDASGNSFTGDIVAPVSGWTALEALSLGDNQLTGPFPDVLSTLTRLTHL